MTNVAGLGTKTHTMLQAAVSDDFTVLELQDVSPLRWVYRATRGPDGAAPLSIYVLFAPVDESRTNVWLQPSLLARIGCKASHMQQVLATGRLDEDRVYAVLTPAPSSTLADSLASGALPLRRALRIGADVCAAWGRLQELGQALGPVPAGRICLEPRWNGSDDLRILSTWFLGEGGQEWEAVDGVVPPEWRPGQDTPMTDAYSVGALIYRAICRHLPYSAAARREAQRQGEPPEWMGVRIPESEGPVPPGLDNLLREMLHYDPTARPTDARRLQGVLLAMLESSTAPTVSPVMLLSDLTDVPAVTRTSAPPVRPPVRAASRNMPAAEVPTEERTPVRPPSPLLDVSPLAFSPPRAPTPVSMATHAGQSRRTVAPTPEHPVSANSIKWFGVAFAGTSLLAVLLVLIVWLALPLPGRLSTSGPAGGLEALRPIDFGGADGTLLGANRRPAPDLADEYNPMLAPHRSVVVTELIPEPEPVRKSTGARRRVLMAAPAAPAGEASADPAPTVSPERPRRVGAQVQVPRTLVIGRTGGASEPESASITEEPAPVLKVVPTSKKPAPPKVVVPAPSAPVEEEPEVELAPIRPSAAEGTDLKNPYRRR